MVYEYVPMNVGKNIFRKSTSHRAIISDYASRGYRYVGFVPVIIGAYGAITQMDLIFEKDEEEAAQA